MLEVFVLTPVHKTTTKVFLSILSLVITIVSWVLACYSPVMLLMTLIFGVLFYFITFRSNKEYECSYFDGEVRFAKIMNKSRRKRLAVYSMDEVSQIAPAGDRSVYRYETDHTVKVLDYTSQVKDQPYYEMVIQKEGDTYLIKFEPDDKYLDAVQVKYAQKVIRKQA